MFSGCNTKIFFIYSVKRIVIGIAYKHRHLRNLQVGIFEKLFGFCHSYLSDKIHKLDFAVLIEFLTERLTCNSKMLGNSCNTHTAVGIIFIHIFLNAFNKIIRIVRIGFLSIFTHLCKASAQCFRL